jgi:hypothetical protein
MEEKFFFSYYYRYSILCAVAYCVPVLFFFKNERFSEMWLLYLGNICFGILLLISGIFVNNKLHQSASLKAMITSGLKVIASSIILMCIITAILAFIFRHNILLQAPVNYNGLYYTLPVNVIVVNFLLGTLCVSIGAFSIKTNQRNEKGEEIT